MENKKKYFVTGLLVLIILTLVVSTFFVVNYLQNRSLNSDTEAAVGPEIALTVDTSKTVGTFSPRMRGLDLAPWEHTWGKPYLGNVSGIEPVLQAIKPGLIRYSGGLWVDGAAFVPGMTQKAVSDASIVSGVKARYPSDTYGSGYYFNYGTDEIDALGTMANKVGADVMVQVNILANNPQMWADMLSYTKSKGYPFKYWEFGNEIDLTRWQGKNNLTPEQYATRVVAYQKALKAVDSSVIAVAGVPAFPVPADWIGQGDNGVAISKYISQPLAATKAAGDTIESLSYHWYQVDNPNKALSDIDIYSYYNNDCNPDTTANCTPTAANNWGNAYTRRWGDILPKRIRTELLASDPTTSIGITELNVSSADNSKVNHNHVGAVWLADATGRLATSGADYSSVWLGYSETDFGMIRHNGSGGGLTLTPSYYTYYMYNKYFGDTLLSASSGNNEKVGIFASRDSKDPGKLKLMITNFATDTQPVKISTVGFNGGAAQVYKLTSDQAISASTNINTELNSALNGTKLTAANVGTTNITPENLTINAGAFNYNLPAFSVTSIIINQSGTATTTSTPTATPTATTTPTATSTPIKTPTPTLPTTTAIPTTTPAGSTPGLKATYYDNMDLTGSSITRTDPNINFRWEYGKPHPSIGEEKFSVIWEGFVQAPTTGEYTFYTSTDDGTRLSVNNTQIINSWIDQPETQRTGKISLEAGKLYPIKMEFFENTLVATATLSWSGPSVSKQIIPSTRFFTSTGTTTPTVAPTVTSTPATGDTTGPTISSTSPANGLNLGTSNLQMSANATDSSGMRKIQIILDNEIMRTCYGVTTCTVSKSNIYITSGSHTITVIAMDNSANRNTTTRTITITR